MSANFDRQSPPHFAASYFNHPGGATVKQHQHTCGQMTLAISGTVRLQSAAGWWLAVPGQAIWLPPKTRHRAVYTRDTELINLDFSVANSQRLVDRPSLYRSSSLARELATEACRLCSQPEDPEADSQLPLIAELLLHQLQPAEAPTVLSIPEGKDKRLLRITAHLHQHPDCADTLEQLAPMAGASARTLARLFISETGMSFTHWREQLRMLLGVEKLQSGDNITTVALELGYNSASSFTTAFRRVLGQPPRQYLQTWKREQ